MTVTSTINSGAINEVGFPGSQQGESLIELIGTVVISTTIATVTVLSTTGATAAPSADGVAGQPKIKAYLTAAVAPSAEASCGAITRIRTVPDALVSQATVSVPDSQLKRRLSATGASSASTSSAANIKTFRGAAASCSASPSSTGSTRRIQFSAYLNSGAFTTLESQRRIPYTATGTAKALWSVKGVMGRAVKALGSASGYGTTTERISKAHFLGAATAPAATSTAATRRNATTSAIVTARAISTGSGRQNATTQLQPLSVAVQTAADSLLKVRRSATINQSLIAVAVGVNMGFKASGATTARAVASCGAVVNNYVDCQPIVAKATVSAPIAWSKIPYSGSTSCAATASSIEPGVRVLRSASRTASASAAASPVLVRQTTALTSCTASVACEGVVENYTECVPQAASAVTSAPNTVARKLLAATVSASANVSDPEHYTKSLRGAWTVGWAPSSASPKLNYRLSAATSAPAQVTSINVKFLRLAFPEPQFYGAVATVGVRLDKVTAAVIEAKADPLCIARVNLAVSATAVAQAIDTAAGIDFAIAVQAPIERRMSVAYQNRFMEVLT